MDWVADPVRFSRRRGTCRPWPAGVRRALPLPFHCRSTAFPLPYHCRITAFSAADDLLFLELPRHFHCLIPRTFTIFPLPFRYGKPFLNLLLQPRLRPFLKEVRQKYRLSLSRRRLYRISRSLAFHHGSVAPFTAVHCRSTIFHRRPPPFTAVLLPLHRLSPPFTAVPLRSKFLDGAGYGIRLDRLCEQ